MPADCHRCGERLEDIPMNRYTNPIPSCCPDRSGPCRIGQEELDRILTALACQNQNSDRPFVRRKRSDRRRASRAQVRKSAGFDTGRLFFTFVTKL